MTPPKHSCHFADLPLTRLHYVRCGEGDPMIIVPATISEIKDWLPFVQFLGQGYRTHFFELPGHGGSEPFDQPFSSELVAESVEQLADHLGLDRFILMGFSFGGVLTFKTLQRLSDRVDKVVLLSPLVSYLGLRHSRAKLLALKATVGTLRNPKAKNGMLKLMHDERTVDALVWFMTVVGKYETNADLRARLLGFPPATLDVLLSQVREVLSVETDDIAGPYTQPCFFGMSVNDPLLDFATSVSFVQEQFTDPIIKRFTFDYHAPPDPFTFEQLDRGYRSMLSAFDD
ncbi:MAG: alpha/beta hydrolase [Actinomycetota bacterium]|jgi:pimeloyl-ACP methyl ester carboxylesterase|nr:alpha/beta hydrolase [Actinomycetota bacterium]